MIKISTPDMCDEYGDAVQVADPIFSHFGGIGQFGGEVVTVKCFEDNSKVGEMLRASGNGRILVVDGGASSRRSVLGDKLAALALENGWHGIVVYGFIRDVEEIAAMPIGVVALGAIPRKTEKRGVGQVNIPVQFAGLNIKPGQYLYADGSGVIVAGHSLLGAREQDVAGE